MCTYRNSWKWPRWRNPWPTAWTLCRQLMWMHDKAACMCMCINRSVCSCSPLPPISIWVPPGWVCSICMSAPITQWNGAGGGGSGGDSHSRLHQSTGDWASQTWGEKERVTLFLGGGDRWELRAAFLGEGWMDGNNILLVVSASRENYGFTANIHSSPALLSLFLFLFLFFFSSPYLCLTTSPSPSLSLSLSLLSVSVLLPLALPHPCVLWHPTPALARQRAGPSLQRPRPQSCDADLLCFTRLQCSEGASEEKGCVHQRQETKQRSYVCVCVRVCACVPVCVLRGDCVCVWVGAQEAVFQGMELHYKKFDIKKRGVFRQGCVQTCCPRCLWSKQVGVFPPGWR